MSLSFLTNKNPIVFVYAANEDEIGNDEKKITKFLTNGLPQQSIQFGVFSRIQSNQRHYSFNFSNCDLITFVCVAALQQSLWLFEIIVVRVCDWCSNYKAAISIANIILQLAKLYYNNNQSIRCTLKIENCSKQKSKSIFAKWLNIMMILI